MRLKMMLDPLFRVLLDRLFGLVVANTRVRYGSGQPLLPEIVVGEIKRTLLKQLLV